MPLHYRNLSVWALRIHYVCAHDPRVANAIPLAGFENIQPTYQMIKALVNTVPDIRIDSDHMMVISPDEGAMNRCIYYTSVLGLDLGMFYKRRDYSRVIEGKNPIVAHVFLGNNIEGKDVIVVDDMISSGESTFEVIQQLKERKARRIFICSTFGLFCEGYEKFDRAYEAGLFDRVFTTNLIYREPELLARPWYTEVSMSKYIAHIINILNHDMSISGLLRRLSVSINCWSVTKKSFGKNKIETQVERRSPYENLRDIDEKSEAASR